MALGPWDTAATSPSTGDQLLSVPVLTGGFQGSACPLTPVGCPVLVTRPWLSPAPFPHCGDAPGTIWGTVSPGDMGSCRH